MSGVIQFPLSCQNTHFVVAVLTGVVVCGLWCVLVLEKAPSSHISTTRAFVFENAHINSNKMKAYRCFYFLLHVSCLLHLSILCGVARGLVVVTSSRTRTKQWSALLSPSRQITALHAATPQEQTDNDKEDPSTRENVVMDVLPDFPDRNKLPVFLQSESYNLIPPALIGVLVGIAVAIFKLSVEYLRDLSYGNYLFPQLPELLLLIPTFGGVLVGLLRTLGPLPPGLRETVETVDRQKGEILPTERFVSAQTDFLRKSSCSIVTLGTGNSLGPEGPSVELGMNVAKIVLQLVPSLPSDRDGSSTTFPKSQRQRLWLSCGAAAGVSAGFNAPLAGVFFSLEVLQSTFQYLDNKNNRVTEFLSTAPGSISAVLLSSVLSALVSRQVLQDTMVLELKSYSLNTPGMELPIFLFLGTLSGLVAVAFSKTANFCQRQFKTGMLKDVPEVFKPAVGGLFCGVVGLFYPQVLFFGYETLNNVLASNRLDTNLVLSLLVLKLLTTAVAAGSGLVGGTFAPSLFLGAMLGAACRDLLIPLFSILPPLPLSGPVLDLADVQAYALVGAGSVLAALFRAPLTASLLLFELTGNYDFILPLLASAGVGSVVADILDKAFERTENKPRRDQDTVSWGDLSSIFNSTKSLDEQDAILEGEK